MAPAKKPTADLKSVYLTVRATERRMKRWQEHAAETRRIEDEPDLDWSAWVRRALDRQMAAELKASKRKGGGR